MKNQMIVNSISAMQNSGQRVERSKFDLQSYLLVVPKRFRQVVYKVRRAAKLEMPEF